MAAQPAPDRIRHGAGLLLAVACGLALLGLWNYLLPRLDGTPFDEARYLVFAGAAVAVLGLGERIWAAIVARAFSPPDT